MSQIWLFLLASTKNDAGFFRRLRWRHRPPRADSIRPFEGSPLAFRKPDKQWTAFPTNAKFELIEPVNWNRGETPARWQGADQAFANELAYRAILDVLKSG